MPYRAEEGCRLRIPEMMGFGGNLVTLMPNGMTGIRLADADPKFAGYERAVRTWPRWLTVYGRFVRRRWGQIR